MSAKAGKFHDYFTSCLPSPLKSDPVEISLTGNAPIALFKDNGLTDIFGINKDIYMNGTGEGTPKIRQWPRADSKKTVLVDGATVSGGATNSGGYLGADLSGVSAISIQDLRMAIALQHIFEADARNGTRYRDDL